MQHSNKYLYLFVLISCANVTDAEPSTEKKSKALLSAGTPYWRAQSVEHNANAPVLPKLKSSLKSENSTAVAKSFNKAVQKNANAAHLIWVYDAWLSTYSDGDNDGYYPSFELTFDADTSFTNADVFAVVYLGDNSTYKEIHTTSVFTIFADASNDEFTFSTELLEGFPSDDYDVLIELYDADTLELQDSYDHTSDPDLSLVSLESAEYEHRQFAPAVNAHEHGGAIGVTMLFALMGLVFFRHKGNY